MAKTKPRPTPAPTDLTLRNLRALRKTLAALARRVQQLERKIGV